MTTLELKNYGVMEMSYNELESIDGGFLPALIFIGVALVAASCNTTAPSSIGGANPMKSDTTRSDSTHR